MLTLYCRADEARMRQILSAGLQSPDAPSQETRQDFKALWLQRQPVVASQERPYLVKVKLDCKLEELDPFDGSPPDRPRTEWLVPVDLIHARGKVLIAPSG
jgi:hypothetical protein